MKLWISLVLSVAALSAADAKKPAAKKPASAAKPVPTTPPPGSKQVESGLYSYTDTKGTKWLYRQTPFGFMRFEDNGTSATSQLTPAAPKDDAGVTAVEDGDSIRFERPGPFGPYRWQKKKTDLTESETAAWSRARDKSGDQAAGASKPE